MSKKYSAYTDELADSILQMFVGAMRQGLKRGIRAAAGATQQDSANAAVHWLVGVDGASRADNRMLGRKENIDLRATKARGKRHPLVGLRGEKRGRGGSGVEEITEREFDLIISRYAKGNNPHTKFYLYNVIGDVKGYSDSDHADIMAAGEAGLTAIKEYFESQIDARKVRSRYLRGDK